MKTNKLILIEFHGWKSDHYCYHLILKAFLKKFQYKIIAYATYPNFFSDKNFFNLNFFLWFFGNLLNIKTFKTYRSIGVEKIFKPSISKIHIKKSIAYLKNYYDKLNITNYKISNFKVKNTFLGDILYDSYLKSGNYYTLDPYSKNFKKFFENFLSLYFYWEEYFHLNKIEVVVVSHSTYLSAIPARIAAIKNKKTLIVGVDKVYQLNKNNLSSHKEYLFYRNIFNNLGPAQKNKLLFKSRKFIKKLLIGEVNPHLHFNKNKNYLKFKFANKNNKILVNSSKKKILISPHSLSDSPHVRGNFIFNDFYEWLIFLFESSKNSKYEWYIKLHPNYINYFDNTHAVIKELVLNKYKHINWIDPKIRNFQLIKEGINVVLTVHGSVGAEFPYYGIPVVNASLNNPHINYNFNFNPRTLEEYSATLKKLHLLKINKKKILNELLEYHSINNIYLDQSWLTKKILNIIYNFGGIKNFYKNATYEFLFSKFYKSEKKISRILERFINTENYCLRLHQGKIVDIPKF